MELNKSKKYDLSQLNDEQLQAVLDWLKENDKYWDSFPITEFKTVKTIFFDGYEWKCFEEDPVNALELFEEDNENNKV